MDILRQDITAAQAQTMKEIDLPHIIESELVTIIHGIMRNHPRSLQSRIGPSEVGHPCSRKLIHKLAGHREPFSYQDRWAAQVGTFGHAGLERGFTAHNEARMAQGELQPRYLLEHEVTVGEAAGIEIRGNLDVFDIDAGCVIDWKFVGPAPLMSYKSKGPGPQYITQAMLYARGLVLQGYQVNHAMIAFLPRSGELGQPELRIVAGQQEWRHRGNRYFWSAPYDESIALGALARLDGLHQLLQLLGPEELLDQFEPCSEFFCPWCSRGRSW